MRYTRLDGLRGLLAVMVALNHSFMILSIPFFANIWGKNIFHFTDFQSKLQQLSMLIGNGGLAVSIFFVMSGFVLAESSKKWSFSPLQILSFYIRRLLRLYPVYLFLVIVSALYMWTVFEYKTYPIAAPWFHWWMQFEMTFKEFILNLTFIHTYLGGVTWTLRVIILASLFFPPMMYLSRKISTVANILVFILLAIASYKLLDFPNFNDLRFLYMFYLGGMLPRFQQKFESVPGLVIILLAAPLTFIALYSRYQTEIHNTGVIESIFAFLLLGVLAYNNKQNMLKFFDSKAFQFLGKISYSLYLVHFTVLYIFAKFILENVPSDLLASNYFLTHTFIFILTTILAIGLSIFVNKFIESPAQQLSRKVKFN